MIGTSLLLASAALAPPSTLLNGLAAYYKLDDLADAVGGPSLVNNGTAISHPAGVFGQCARAGSTTSYLSTGGIVLGTEFSIGAWVKVATQSGNRGTIAAAGGSGVGLYVDPDGSFSFFDGVDFRHSTAGWAANAWQHVLATYVLSEATIRFYVAGLAAGAVTSTIAPLTIAALMGYVGGGGVLSLGNGSGQLDEAGLWTRALSSVEAGQVPARTYPL